jgi:hypothetical protein
LNLTNYVLGYILGDFRGHWAYLHMTLRSSQSQVHSHFSDHVSRT